MVFLWFFLWFVSYGNMVQPRCDLRFQEAAIFISAVDTPLPQNAELYRALLLDYI